jgi:hypothetical protein
MKKKLFYQKTCTYKLTLNSMPETYNFEDQ